MTDQTHPEQSNSGVDLIAAERQRQIDAEDWTAEHDDSHKDNALAWAATCYAAPGRIYVERHQADRIAFVDPWPFEARSDLAGRGFYDWDKRKKDDRGYQTNYVQMPPAGDRLDYLVKAGALIAAEIDRIQRSRRS